MLSFPAMGAPLSIWLLVLASTAISAQEAPRSPSEFWRERATLRGSLAAVVGLEFRPPNRLAGRDEHGTTQVWDIDSGEILAGRYSPYESSPTSCDPWMQVPLDTRYQIRVSGLGLVAVHELPSKDLRFTLDHPLGARPIIVLSGDKTTLAAQGRNGILEIWDLETGRRRASIQAADGARCLAFSPEGKQIATVGADRDLRLWDAETGAALGRFSSDDGDITALAFSFDGKSVATGSSDRTVKVYQRNEAATPLNEGMHNRSERGRQPWTGRRTISFFTGGGESIMLRRKEDDRTFAMTTRVWQEGTDVVGLSGDSATEPSIRGLIFCGRDKNLVSGGDDGAIRIRGMNRSWLSWNSAAMALPVTGSPARSVACDATGDFASGHDDGTVAIQGDIVMRSGVTGAERTGRHRLEMPLHTASVRRVLFSPDGRYLFSAASDGTVVRLDMKTFRPLPFSSALRGNGGVRDLAVSGDGEALAGVRDDGTLFFARTGSSRPLAPLKLDGRPGVIAISFSADNRWFAYSWGSGQVQVVDWKSGEERFRLGSPIGDAEVLAVSPDGELLASAGKSGLIRVWDLNDPKEPKTLSGHTARVTSLTFSSNGRLIAAAGADNTIRLYDTHHIARSGSGNDDVDYPPISNAPADPDAYAVVIGVEKHRNTTIPPVVYAARDARTVREYLTRGMGFAPENVALLLDEEASKADIVKYLGSWLRNRVGRRSKVIVYFAGHGAPDPESGVRYIVPNDGDPDYLADTAYPVRTVYETLAALPAPDIRVVFDACFIGRGARSLIAAGRRPLVTTTDSGDGVGANTVVIAASGAKSVSTYAMDERHGLLTKYLLRGLRGEADLNGDNRVTTEELFRYLRPRVESEARKQNVTQIPIIIPDIPALDERGGRVWMRKNSAESAKSPLPPR